MIQRLAIIGAGDFQEQLIIKAKERGMETHVFAWKTGAAGEREADFFYPISIVEKEQILEKCRKINPMGIVSIGSDLAVITVNYVAEMLNLTGNGMKSAWISTNKYLMRRAFEQHGDPSPKFCCSRQWKEGMLEFPLIVKPTDRSGSRGVTKVADRERIAEAIRNAEQTSFQHKAVIEEFVEGQEYSVEYISWQGKHIFLALTQKITTGEPNYIEIGHIQPAEISSEVLCKIQNVVCHALDSLMIKNGASHAEVKVTPSEEVIIIEIGARMGGDCIGSDLVQISTGYDYVSMVIDIACGKEPVFEKKCTPKRAEIRFILDKEDLKKYENIKKTKPECLYRECMNKQLDDKKVTDSSERYGYYIIRG